MSTSFLGLPVSIITGFIAFRSVDPYFMGVWTTILVFETYANFLRMGVINGMNRELPHALGSGNTDKAMSYLRTTFAYSLFNIILVLIFSPILFLTFELSPEYLFAIIVFVLKLVLSFYSTFLAGTFRSNDDFDRLSNVQFWMLGVKLGLVPLVYWGFYGFVVMQGLIVLINTALLHINRPYRKTPKFEWWAFVELAKTGFPLFVTSYLITFVDTFPRLYIVKFGDERLMGIYSPVLMLISTVGLLPNVISSYLYPKFSFKMGESNNRQLIWEMLSKMYIVSFFLICVIAFIAYLSLDYFVLFFPKYKESLPYLNLAIFICPFLMYKLGNTLSAVYKSYSTLVYYCVVYFITQIFTLYVFSLIEIDILKIVIYSQIATASILFIFSLIMNWYIASK